MENTSVEENKDLEKVYIQMQDDARKYVYNVLGFEGEYTKEAFNLAASKVKIKDILTNYDATQKNINIETLLQGYEHFGRQFLDAVYDKDKDSLLNMFEVVTQEFIMLQRAVIDFESNMQQALKDKNNASNS